MYVAVNVPVNTRCIGVPDKLLAWLNKCLRTSLTKVEQLCTGVTYCLLMDRLFPGILDLSEVRFRSNNTTDSIYNFSLLEDAFKTVGVLRYVPTEDLMQSNPTMSLAFLQWFKLFFDKNNHNGGQYKALRNTEGQTMATDDTGGVPAQSPKPVEVENMEESNQEKEMPKENLQGVVPPQTPKPVEVENMEEPSKEKEPPSIEIQMPSIEMESPVKREETPIKDKHTPKENVSKNDDVIVLISDDDDDFVDVTSEENTVTMETTTTTTTTTNTTPTIVNVETQVLVVNNMPQPAALVVTAAAVDNTTPRDSRSGDNMLSFVKRYCTNNGDADSDSMATILGQTVPKDIVEGCYRSPYCLYLYMGVEVVGGGDSTSVVLIGYLDLSSGTTVVRLLNTLQMSLDVGVDIVAGASTDAQFLIDMLKMNYFPLNNLAVFYCNATDQQVGRVFTAQLRAFNPRLISLCGVPGMAARACQAGLTAAFPSVVDLIQSIHRHYSTSSPVNGTLKALFSPQEAYKPSQPIATQCLFIINTVQKMVSIWRELVDYFKSLGGDGEGIRAQLMCYKVRLHFLFLAHTLEPLRALQELQQYGRVELTMELQLISMLVNCYATSLLTPEVAERFLRELNPRVLPLIKQVLPMTERNIGPAARDFLWASSVADLGEKERRDFQQNAVTFYKVALSNLVESIPKQLGDLAMRNIGKVLKNPAKIDSTKSHYDMVGQLGVNLGLFEARSHDRMQLYQDYKYFIEKMKQTNRTGKDLSWGKMLQDIRPYSNLRRLLLILLALPDTLRQTQVFDKMFSYKESPKAPAVHDKPEVTPPKDDSPTAATPRNYPTVTKRPVQAVTKRPLNNQSRYREDKMEEETDEDDSSATEDSEDFNPQISRRKRYGSTDESNDTDNSSDVVEVIQKSRMCQIRRLPGTAHSQVKEREKGQTVTKALHAESVYVVGEDDSDEEMVSASTPPRSTETLKRKIQTSPSRMSNATKGDLVWAQVEGFSPWPAVVIDGGTEAPGKKMVDWYGQNMSSQVSIQTLKPFATFSRHFCSNSFAILATYREAIYMSLQEASLRCRKEFSAFDEDREELVKEMLDWAFGGFNPSGPEGLKQAADANGFVRKPHSRPKVKKKSFLKANSSPHNLNSTAPVNKPIHPELQDKLRLQPTVKLNNINNGGKYTWEEPFKLAPKVPKLAKEKPAKPAWDREKEYRHSGWGSAKAKGGVWKKKKKKISLSDRYDNDVSPDFVPAKKRNYNKVYNKMADKENVYRQPDQHLRDEIIRRIMDMKLDIDGFCLCCGTEDVEIFHPLFKGSLCSKCKDNLTETLYRYDEDGYQSYCTICCYGMEVILCGNDSCCRSYCEDCLNVLVAPGMFDSLKVLDPWICYLCQPHRAHGALTPREDWSIRVQNLFANNSAMEFEPHRVYPSIPANMRRPLRVLSLFDGIATGLVVLKELGFKVEKYVASEVCDDSLAVATINHDGKIIHVGDVRRITLDLLEEWGPFDLLIGGSPCNDLSIVNPIRKGLYEGTGRLFFEYYRILQLLKPKEEDPRPFFWLFENVVFMNTHDKVNICRFLECNPVLVNAVKVSPAHRARCFWGNIPGMSRPITASQTDKLTLQECLEIGREARVTKVRTITTNPNSLKQGSTAQLPVLQNGKEDNLWITELERIFGFPKHYTDVRNMNRQQRQKVLGKAWSVPVIRHLFAPLKDYFSCEELPPLTNNTNTTNSLSSSSSSAPDSPDLLR